MNAQAKPDAEPRQRPIQKRAERTREQVIAAVIACLDEDGYADTSINAIQARAGLSRGSMSHHFPTRQDMILAAAQHLLNNALAGVEVYFRQLQKVDAELSEYDIIRLFWTHIVDTPEGRAFIEVMMASRTDAEIGSALSAMFAVWEEQIDTVMRDTYGDNADTIGQIWDMSRTYLQGLLLNKHVAMDAAAFERKITLFAELLSAQTMGAGRG